MPTIRFKDGVQFQDMHVSMMQVLLAAAHIWQGHGAHAVVVTSARDGQHMSESLHYRGKAIDLRRWDLDDPQAAASTLRAILGPDFDVVTEDTHIHVEWDPPQ